MKISNVMQVIDPSGLTYYLGTILPSQIMELTFVPCVVKVNEDILVVRTADGYQREGDGKRMKQIKEFYAANNTSLIPPVLLSTRGAWKFTPSAKGSPFGSIEASDLAAAIDGQHRLGGLSMLAQDGKTSETSKNRTIPFMAVEFSEIKVEADEFEVINGKQKGIKPSHLKYIRRTESFEGNAALMLKEDEDSVFCQRIAIDNRKDSDIITFGAAIDLVKETFNNYFCLNTKFRPSDSEENQAKAMQFLLNYWKLVAQIFDVMWSDKSKLPPVGSKKSASHPGRNKFEFRLIEETGLRVFARLGSHILYKAWIPSTSDVAWQTVETLLSKVSNDSMVNLVMQKLNASNRDEILALDPGLFKQGTAGVPNLYNIIVGALDRA